MRVSVSVADLRKTKTVAERVYQKDVDQETQLLFNEPVAVHRIEGEWAWVEAVEQLKFYEDEGWKGYCGWVQRAHLVSEGPVSAHAAVVGVPWTVLSEGEGRAIPLSFGTRLSVIGEEGTEVRVHCPGGGVGVVDRSHLILEASERKDVLAYAAQFLGFPYHWGGGSAYAKEAEGLTSVDCSGLVMLAYRAVGIDLPRDARDQFRVTAPLKVEDQVPGDLIFSAPKARPDAIDHVMLNAGGGMLLEATMRHRIVRCVSFEEKFGVPMDCLGECAEAIFFRRLLRGVRQVARAPNHAFRVFF